jgi:hypothetical protein
VANTPACQSQDLWTNKMGIWITLIVIFIAVGLLLIVKFIKKNIPKSDIEESLSEIK